MADTTPAEFDPAPEQLGSTISFTAGATILAGQVVGFAGTGGSWTVRPAVLGTTSGIVGVAMNSAATGETVSIASIGSVVKVCEGKGSAIKAGAWISASTVAGCVVTLSVASAAAEGVGIALEDIGANSTGYVFIFPWYVGKAAS